MSTQRLLLVGSLLLIGSTRAHASTLVNPIFAMIPVPEPSSVIVSAGLLLLGLSVVRKRQKSK